MFNGGSGAINVTINGGTISGYRAVWVQLASNNGAKATVNARFDANMQVVTEGAQIMIGGNESYIAMCHRCWHETIKRQKKNGGNIL